jgi:hypothetical protein
MAYYDSLSNQVVMYEEVKSQDVKQDLVVRQLICTIAHEGVHQILNNIGVQHRLSIWPMWLSEGLAEYFAPTVTKQEFRWDGAGRPNDLRLYELEKYLHVRAAESQGELVEHTVLASKLTSTGYATAWALTHYLAKQRRKEFGDYLRDVSGLGALEGPRRVVPPGITPENLTAFKLFFGEDVVDLERRVLLHIQQMPFNDPFADSKHFVVTVLHRRFRQAAVFHTRELAERWRPVMIERFSAEERGQVETQIVEFENRALAEQFAFKWRSAK